MLPADLLNGLDDLRLLGNDAAHIESQEYNQVGKEEVEVGSRVSQGGSEGGPSVFSTLEASSFAKESTLGPSPTAGDARKGGPDP